MIFNDVVEAQAQVAEANADLPEGARGKYKVYEIYEGDVVVGYAAANNNVQAINAWAESKKITAEPWTAPKPPKAPKGLQISPEIAAEQARMRGLIEEQNRRLAEAEKAEAE
jgi:hypothetical protein